MATDSKLNVFVGYGTAAARAAFTPAPPTPASGFSPLYVYYETDTNLVWHYTTAWHCISKPEGAFALPGDISPSQITADQNDYNPTGLSTASTLRLNSDASRNITGLQGGADGRLLFVHNVGSFNIVLKDESASSTAANRFALTADVTLSADSVCILQYDSTSSRWRAVSGGGSGGGSFTAASTTEVLTGTDNSKGVTPDSLAALWEQGSDVASAATVSLGEGGYFNITGTTTITDIDFATDKAGRTAWVKFAGALTLTHNSSTLILPSGANITTAAGDTACFVSEGADAVRCVAYERATGKAVVPSGVTIIRLVQGTGATTNVNVNSTSYTAIGLYFTINLDDFPFTQYQIIGQGQSNAAGQTISLQLATFGAPTTPIHTGGDDITGIPNTGGSPIRTSGWLSRDDGATTGYKEYALVGKGSNTTVDLLVNYLDVWLR